MYKLKKLDEVSKPLQIVHAVALGMELAMMIASLGLFIHELIIGDPNNRSGPILSATLVFALPFLIEILTRRRFPFLLHALFTVHVTLALFLGSALDFHHTVEPYDEIMHFLFGYMASVYVFYFLIAWRDYPRQKKYFVAFLIFMMSLGAACLWEVSEFSMDVFLGQNSLGYPIPEVLLEGQAMGLTGVKLAVHCLSNGVTVWDTVTDMALHLGGTLLFLIQFAIESHVHKRLMLERIKEDYYRNRSEFYSYIPDKPSAECVEHTTSID